MKKLFVTLCALSLFGAGCLSVNKPTTGSEYQGIIKDLSFPSGSWTFIENPLFRLPVDDSFTVEQEDGQYRIQNFIGSDDPNYVYADDAFFIEIKTKDLPSEATFTANYEPTTTDSLGNEEVLVGLNRATGGESWPGESYLNEKHLTAIYLYYQSENGKKLAEAVTQMITWE